MIAQRRFKRMLIEVRDGLHLLQMGEMEIWDGADLALLREGLFRLIDGEECEAGWRGGKSALVIRSGRLADRQ